MVKIIRWLPAVLIMACSWYLSSLSRIEDMPGFFDSDKLVHLICFGGLAFWVAFGVEGLEPRKLWQILLPIIIVSAYGVVDEVHQSFVAGRTASVGDWIADALGAALGSYAYVLVRDWAAKYLNK